MGLLDSRPETETSRDDLILILAAVVRAYGMQEASGKGSKVIVDQYEIEAAKKAIEYNGLGLYQLDSDVATTMDDRFTFPARRYVIEVRE